MQSHFGIEQTKKICEIHEKKSKHIYFFYFEKKKFSKKGTKEIYESPFAPRAIFKYFWQIYESLECSRSRSKNETDLQFCIIIFSVL